MGEFYSTDGSQTILNKQQKYVLDLYNQLGPSNKIRAESYLEGLADGSYRLSFSCVLLFVYGPLANTR